MIFNKPYVINIIVLENLHIFINIIGYVLRYIYMYAELTQACNCIYPKRNDFINSHAIRSNNQHIPPINVKNNAFYDTTTICVFHDVVLHFL